MKTLRLLFLVTLAVGFATASLAASDAKSSASAAKPMLQVSVSVPDLPGNSLEANRYAGDAFTATLAKTFKRQGYPNEIVVLRHESDAKSDVTLLKLRLVEWRSTIPGEIRCTFDATLFAGEKQQDLGRFSATERVGFDQDHAMKTAATAAVKKLCERLGVGAPVAVQ